MFYTVCITLSSQQHTVYLSINIISVFQKQPPRLFSKISVLFFQEQPFYNFPGGSICSSNRHEFSRRVYMFFEQTQIFQEGLLKRHDFLRRSYLFVEQTLLSHRTDTNFSRKPYLVLEHIRIFQEALSSPRTHTIFQKILSSPRTHTIFQETPMPRTHRHFPGRCPLWNRYFVNRSRWLLSVFDYREVWMLLLCFRLFWFYGFLVLLNSL